MIYSGTYSLTLREELNRKLHSSEIDGNFKYLNNLIFNELVSFGDPRDFIINKSKGNQTFGKNTALIDGYVDMFETDLYQPVNGIYVIASVETFLKFATASSIKNGNVLVPESIPCNSETVYHLNISAGIDAYNKFVEGIGTHSPLRVKRGETQFLNKLTSYFENSIYFTPTPFDTYLGPQGPQGPIMPSNPQIGWTNELIDKGIVELGLIGDSSKLDYDYIFKKWFERVDNYTDDLNSTGGFLFRDMAFNLLDSGIVVYTLKSGGILISGIETATRYFGSLPNFNA